MLHFQDLVVFMLQDVSIYLFQYSLLNWSIFLKKVVGEVKQLKSNGH